MADNPLIQEIGDGLISQALAEPNIVDMFSTVCEKLYAAGVPLARARLTWPTLHPLFQAETVLWYRGQPPELEQFRHQGDKTEDWYKSPMYYMLEHDVDMLRRHLDGPNKLVDFELLEELIERGLTDYLTIRTAFESADQENNLV